MIVVYVLGALVATLFLLVLVVFIVGSRYPVDHVFRRTLHTNRKPEEVWAVITDFANQSAWNPLVRSVERLPDRNGHAVWLQVHAGGPPMTLETVEEKKEQRLVRTIADEKLAFSGRWEYDLVGTSTGSELSLTEYGTVPNPIFRFMVNVLGPGKYVDLYLQTLAKKFGEEPAKLEPPL